MQLQITTVAALLACTAVMALLALWSALSRKGRSEDEARAYLAGVTYVLSGDPDAAIAELSKAAQLNRQTLETYFALGALFRRKGELDRAIRLHANMLLRPGLSAHVRRRAQVALAVDYKRSSLRDKAAETLEKLLAEEPDDREGLVCYRQVCEEQGDWQKAASLQRRWVALEAGKGEDILAHLLAAEARRLCPADPVGAVAAATQAVRAHDASADAQWAMAETLVAAGDPGRAAAPLRRAMELEPEIAPRLVNALCLAEPNPAERERLLVEQISKRGPEGAPLELALALVHKRQGAIDRAIAVLRGLVEREGQFFEARRELGALLLAQNRSEELRADYMKILGTLGQPTTAFACQVCDQKLPEHAFRCPSCENWDSIRRERSLI